MDKRKGSPRARAVRAALAALEKLTERDEARQLPPQKDTLYAIQLALAATQPAGRRKRRADGSQK
jgi:hypothetical protein